MFTKRGDAALLLCGVLLLLVGLNLPSSGDCSQNLIEELSCSFHSDDLCNWQFVGGESYTFEPMFNSTNVDYDIDDTIKDRVLVVRLTEENQANNFAEYSLKSPTFETGDYELNFNLNMNFKGYVYVIVVNERNIESQILKIISSRAKIWETYSIKLPKNDKINVILEFKFEHLRVQTDYIAINNINIVDKRRASKMDQCFHQCKQSDACITRSQVCDTVLDCPDEDDETQKCDKLPKGSYCSFQDNFCGWYNFDNANSSGHWIYLENEGLGAVFRGEHRFGVTANLKSAVFEPIPMYHSIVSSKYYQTCQISFAYLFSATSAELSLVLEPIVENQKPYPIRLWRYFNKKNIIEWRNVSEAMPVNFHYKYRLRFSAALGLRSSGPLSQTKSVSINRVSLSRECFGIGVPESEPRIPSFLTTFATTEPFHIPQEANLKKSYHFTTCGAKGQHGPIYSQCEAYYLNTTTRSAIFETANSKLNGTQMWTVPKSGYYSIFAKGADGGKGLYGHSGGKGALVRAVFYLSEGDTLFLVIGQAGTNACNKNTKDEEQCKSNYKYSNQKPRVEVGGGGGGGTFIFQFKPDSPDHWIPLLIAGGGGGGSGNINPDYKYSINQNGQGFDYYNIGAEGNGDGSGGGWNFTNVSKMEGSQQSGKSLLFGAEGGLTCRRHSKWQTNGGFGGAGAGCTNGGGGGGFHGGNANKYSKGGDGGTSFVDFEKSFLQSYSDINKEPNIFDNPTQDGEVIVVPQVEGCCNQNRLPCLISGEASNGTTLKHCICGVDKFMPHECTFERMNYVALVWVLLCILLLFLLIFLLSFIVTQKRSAKKKKQLQRNVNDMLLPGGSTELQLTKVCNHKIDTTTNPNYEFGGSICSLEELPEIPREKLSLVKALGQGAFGEVYQGFLHNLPGEVTDELPVAVKTLPEYSATKQSEYDFLVEANIMSKFKHRNVVRFIGVCFNKMPRFIVLELLPGGDLKTFLRENRNTIEQKSPLVMGDILVMALDVAYGCQYLEDRHFIHRDIAARNCLLTSKAKMPSSKGTLASTTNYQNGFNNSGIVAKIADFGMARDIYRADYYRKGGKTMLPVKWMPPEAFLDGIFTAKTDVWSFGVLLWEVMSMGYMPYPGRGNQEVMQLVTSGGRLEAPNTSTPPHIYSIMAQCWNATPEFRPTFAAIIEKLEHCLQDPKVLNVSLPIFHRAASMEKDVTLMRPSGDTTEYLVPNNLGSQTTSNYSMATEKTDLLSPDTCSTMSCALNEDKLMELEEQVPIAARVPLGVAPAPAAALWAPNPAINGTIPIGLDVNNMTYNFVPTDTFTPEIILTANNLAYPTARYVNVNVSNELYNEEHPPPPPQQSSLQAEGGIDVGEEQGTNV